MLPAYSEDHPVGMEVPKGGSACSKCRYFVGGLCREEKFIQWNGSNVIPVEPDRYCCDFFEAGSLGARDAFVEEFVRQVVDADAETIRAEEAEHSKTLNKLQRGVVEFMGELIKVSTVNGQFVRKPKEAGGAGLLEFTMGGNWYAGDTPGYYRPICDEDEVVLHDLLSRVDFIAVLVHELTERYVMKNLGLDYETAHYQWADPAEEAVRLELEAA